jgi:protein ImuB
VPPPSPATVHVDPLPAEVVDGDGQAVAISARGHISGGPRRVSVSGGAWSDVVAWAGPWPADERWWDPCAHRRRARLQVQLADGGTHLVALERGRWCVEATYD